MSNIKTTGKTINYPYRNPCNCITCGQKISFGNKCQLCVDDQNCPIGDIVCEKCGTGQPASQVGGSGQTSLSKVPSFLKTITLPPTAKEQQFMLNKVATQQCFRDATGNFLKAGALLKESRDNHLWDVQYESFQEYIEDLNLPVQASYSWATRLIAISELCVAQNINPEHAYQIGVGKLALLVPKLRHGELTQEMLTQAETQSTEDFRETLGYKRTETNKEHELTCPFCGNVLRGAKWVTKEKQNASIAETTSPGQ